MDVSKNKPDRLPTTEASGIKSLGADYVRGGGQHPFPPVLRKSIAPSSPFTSAVHARPTPSPTSPQTPSVFPRTQPTTRRPLRITEPVASPSNSIGTNSFFSTDQTRRDTARARDELNRGDMEREKQRVEDDEARTTNTGNRNDHRADNMAIVEVQWLLNILFSDNFEFISDLIVIWVNSSEGEDDAWTLLRFTQLVREQAISEATRSQLYARLCRKIMEQVSPAVMDKDIRDTEGQPISGGQLFRKYLLNRCNEDFEGGWNVYAKPAMVAATNTSKMVPRGEIVQDYENAKRQGLGLVRFIGELFKMQMLTERIMHECIKKLLSNVDDPGEEEIESVCVLLHTVGQSLDTTKARGHMDIYFRRMKDLSEGKWLNSRLRFMLLDVIELRSRHWIPRGTVATPKTILAVNEQVRASSSQQAKLKVSKRSWLWL